MHGQKETLHTNVKQLIGKTGIQMSQLKMKPHRSMGYDKDSGAVDRILTP
jgi:hypothetical protein